MHTLYLTSYDSNRRILATRAVRQALQSLGLAGDDADYAAADRVLGALDRDGHALLGSSPDPTVLAVVTANLKDADCEAVMDYNPDDSAQRDELQDRRARREQTRRDRAEGRTPEEAFAQHAPGKPAPPVTQDAGTEGFRFSPQANMTAQALLVMADGNPINAAGFAFRLDHTTEDGLWEEVQESIIQTFPFVANVMLENSMRIRENK
jgi:hypothetical protein